MQKGRLSSQCRNVRLKNMLTAQEHTLEVPCEELLSDIRSRYEAINSHSTAYIWKALVPAPDGSFELKELDLNLTLSGNGVRDETETFEDCNLGDDFFLPVLQLYWSDDLTVA